MMNKNDEIRNLLKELKEFLVIHFSSNWVPGINAALEELEKDNESGFRNAAAIYLKMSQIKHGLSDLYIPIEKETEILSEQFDYLRERLLELFQRQ